MPQTRLYILDQGDSTDRNTQIGRIFTCLTDGTNGYDLVTGLKSHPDGIAVCSNHKYIFWTNMGHPGPGGWTNSGSIQRCDLDGKNIVTIIEPGTTTHTPKQLVITEKQKKLYWCDREGMRVMRCDLDGGNVETLVRNGDVGLAEHRSDYLRWCVGIAVDEGNGFVYWTQKGPPKGGKGKILRCPIAGAGENGEGIETLFEGLPEPIDLCLDRPAGMMYWTDRGDIPLGNTVNRARIPGKGEKVTHEILVRKLHEGIGLELDVKNRAMFITDLLGGVYRADLDGSHERVLFPDLGTVTGIAIAHFD
ncbi:low-density lipoprotein receptor [Acephala macrosclerotiorum]|nr:low-density lipoprotein receptor [Acephala macrosclerotiorum]